MLEKINCLKIDLTAVIGNWKWGIEFEFTACYTPQHNHLAELALATIAMMHAAS